MKFKNIIFDFGNVLAEFNVDEVLEHYCPDKSDRQLMKEATFFDWDLIDSGKVSYDEYIAQAATKLPERLLGALDAFKETWYQHLNPVEGIWKLIPKLKKKGYALYILSNASTYFADHSSFFEITKEFDGIVFSAPIKMAKPEPDIYHYLFDTFHLNPEECFFIDDREDNIETGRSLGMDGLVFTPDKVEELTQKLL